MDGQDWLWVIVGIAALAIIVVALVVLIGKRRTVARSAQAESLRREASERSKIVDQREAKAAEVDAHARAARAESEAKAAEAARLEAAAARQAEESAQARTEVDEQWQQADEIDPSVPNETDGSRPERDPDPATAETRPH